MPAPKLAPANPVLLIRISLQVSWNKKVCGLPLVFTHDYMEHDLSCIRLDSADDNDSQEFNLMGNDPTKKREIWAFVVAACALFGGLRVGSANGKGAYAVRAKHNEGLTKNIEVIYSGFLIHRGCYVEPPYIVKLENDKIFIDGLEVAPIRPTPFFQRTVGMEGFDLAPSERAPAHIRQCLQQNDLLMVTHDCLTVHAPVRQAIRIFDILLSDEAQDAKVQMLVEVGPSAPSLINSEQWALLANAFEASIALSDRILAVKQARTEYDKSDFEHELVLPFVSGITIVGFVLAVWALGTLLSTRPPAINGERTVDCPKTSSRRVIWLVILLVVLNIYDLACTLLAQGVGGLWELNPIAKPIVEVESAAVITTFKLSLLVGAAVLLLVGRHLRIAQIGVWWIGVTYTVLIVRWTTFNSMFL